MCEGKGILCFIIIVIKCQKTDSYKNVDVLMCVADRGRDVGQYKENGNNNKKITGEQCLVVGSC